MTAAAIEWPRDRAVRAVRRVLLRAGLPAARLSESAKLKAADRHEGVAGHYVWVWPTRAAELGAVPRLSNEQIEIAAAALSAHFTILRSYPALGMICVRIPA